MAHTESITFGPMQILSILQLIPSIKHDRPTSLNPAMGTIGDTLPPCGVLHILNRPSAPAVAVLLWSIGDKATLFGTRQQKKVNLEAT